MKTEKDAEKMLEDFVESTLIYREYFSGSALIDKIKTQEGIKEMRAILRKASQEMKLEK